MWSQLSNDETVEGVVVCVRGLSIVGGANVLYGGKRGLLFLANLFWKKKVVVLEKPR